jgi:hypothetical protein
MGCSLRRPAPDLDASRAPSGSARNDARAAQPAVVVALAQVRGMIRQKGSQRVGKSLKRCSRLHWGASLRALAAEMQAKGHQISRSDYTSAAAAAAARSAMLSSIACWVAPSDPHSSRLM